MSEPETKEVLIITLKAVKALAIYSLRQHEWIGALASTMSLNPVVAAQLGQHPSYDLGSDPSLEIIRSLAQNIDALIAQLR